MIFIAFSFLMLLVYALLVLGFVLGWSKLRSFIAKEDVRLFVSVVVPFRNETKNLPTLLKGVLAQSYQHFELILVNDHSSDSSLDMIRENAVHIRNMRIIEATGFGKKNALKEGIAQAKGELIVCSDADCDLAHDWLRTIASFQEKENCDLIIAPVRMQSKGTLLENLQVLEFSSLIAAGAGAAGLGLPILCNGSNLAFKPQVWSENEKDLNEQQLSGDDMFLMMSIKKRKGKIRFLKSTEATVETKACDSLSDFFNQRKRWASKSPSYKDAEVILVGTVVLLVSILIISAIVAGFFDSQYWVLAIYLYASKMIIDSCLLAQTSPFFKTKNLLKFVPLLTIIYPLYICISFFGGLLGHFHWKENK